MVEWIWIGEEIRRQRIEEQLGIGGLQRRIQGFDPSL
jgi:hypothetical protein